MAIGLKSVLGVKESTDIDIAGALLIHHFDLLGVPHDQAHLELFSRLLCDIPDSLFVFRRNLCLVDLDPAFEDTLGDGGRRMVDLTILNRLVRQSAPLSQEIPIFHVDPGCANQIITE